jgi:protein gp37
MDRAVWRRDDQTGVALMAETSAIGWTDATVNFWWGCTKVGPGCDFCYAETWAKRCGFDVWGHDVARRKIAGAVALIRKLNVQHAAFFAEHGRRRRVFIQSMADLFDKEVPVEWFAEAWNEIDEATNLDIQIVTKRASFVEKRLSEVGEYRWPEHVGLIISVVNQDEADRDIPRLLDLKWKFGISWVGLSMEPLLGPVDLDVLIYEPCPNSLDGLSMDQETGAYECCSKCDFTGVSDDTALDWIIVGMESGGHARHQPHEHAQRIVNTCLGAGVPVFVKQLSSGKATPITDIEQFPEGLRVRQFPETTNVG